MQGQRSTVESLPETFEFEHGSSSNSSGFDQQMYWNNNYIQVETQNLPSYPLPPTDVNMPYMNMGNHEIASLSTWNAGGPSSSEHSLNLGRHDESKMDHDWTSLTINAGSGPRIEERGFDASNILSLENVNINLNTNQVDDGQIFQQNSSSSNELQGAEHNAGSVGITCEFSESGLCPNPISGILKLVDAPSSSGSLTTRINSPIGVRFMSEDGDERPGSSLDGRRLACKRKNTEGFHGQSSTSGSTSFFPQNESSILHSIPASHNASISINLSSSSDYLNGASSSEEQLNPRISTIVRGMAPDCYPSPSVAGNAESSHRNFRLRINPAHLHDFSPPNLFAQGNNIRRSGVWLPNQQSSLVIPFNQSPDSRPVVSSSSSQSQHHIPIIPCLPRHVHSFPWSGTSNPRIGNSSNSISSEERSTSTRDETSSRSISRNNFQEQSVFVPTADIRHLVQDPTNWNLANGHIGMTGNVAPPRTDMTSGLHPSVGPTWAPHQNPPTQYPRSLSEVVRQSLFSSNSWDSEGQSSNFVQHRSGHPATSQEAGHQSGAGFRGLQQPYTRSAFLIERPSDGVLGVPLSMRSLAATREGRSSRMISEIRNALDHVRRGGNLRFEDVFLLDQSLFYGAADLHDRHRDMRLDVDNMSYEELLALEEQLGNVSTGLSEETVSKCLKQQKYLAMRVEGSMEYEPCCICQEEYVEGDNLGTLDCGHDFHTPCIKQWLMHKNLCPICKTTALVT